MLYSAKNKMEMLRIYLSMKAHEALDGTKAEAYVDTGVKILIAVVIGALLLGILVWLFNEVIKPSVSEKVDTMFGMADEYMPGAGAILPHIG